MSELKAKHVVDVYDAYSSNPYNEAQVYLKSEADKVIAEKDNEIARLDDLAHAHNLELLLKENRIEELKYKRCLAMARWCDAELLAYPSFGTESPKEKWWQKWHKRWLAIAEEFKPNSTINKKGGTNALQR